MSTFNLSQFRGQVLGGYGLARTNRFEIIVVPPPALQRYGAMVSILAEQAYFPLKTLGVKPFAIHNTPVYQRPTRADYGGEGAMFTFHVDGQMKVKRFFDDWMDLVIDKNDYSVSYQDQYASTVYVSQLNEMDQVVYDIRLTEAFPRNFNPMELDNTAQSQTHRLTVMFSFRKWEEVQHFQYIEQDVPLKIQQPQSYSKDNRIK